jgi:chaperone BCS1
MSSPPNLNPSVPLNGTVPATPLALPSDLSSLIGLLFSFTALRDWLKLIVIGSFLETCRRFVFSLWRTVIDSCFITAQFKEDDSSYDWMMVWLSKQPAWQKAREVEISTSNFGLNSAAVLIPGEEDGSKTIAGSGRQLAYLPSVSATYSIFYKRRWMQISRTQGQTGYYGRTEDTLQISILTRDHGFLNNLLIDAKKDYQAADEHNISVYISDATNNWKHVASRPKRPLRSIVLDPGIKDLLIEDARDFLASKSWYADRGKSSQMDAA